MIQTLYTGPGKLFYNGLSLFPEGENGPCNITIDEKASDVSSGMFGYQGMTWEDVTAKIVTTPFDNWGNMATLFPAYLGISTGSTPGTMLIGTNPYTSGMIPVSVWGADTSLYSFVNGAITKHPDIMLGPSKPLFGSMDVTCIGNPALNPGASSFLMSAPITETGAADPGATATMNDFIRGWWSATWGTITGFASMEAEDFWTISINAKYSFQTVQKVTRRAKLDSVQIMAKARLVGPTHTQLLGKILAHTHGELLTEGTASDLVLTGPSGKTITLKNCEVKNAGFSFGGTRLRTDEVGFITALTFSTGLPQPQLIISA